MQQDPQKFPINQHNSLRLPPNSPKSDRWARTIRFAARPTEGRHARAYQLLDYFSYRRYYRRPMAELFRVERWENSHFDSKLIKTWIDTCEKYHRRCLNVENTANLPSEFRVVDSYHHCVIELPSFPPPRFVALSYTWSLLSDSPDIKLERKNLESLKQAGSLPESPDGPPTRDGPEVISR